MDRCSIALFLSAAKTEKMLLLLYVLPFTQALTRKGVSSCKIRGDKPCCDGVDLTCFGCNHFLLQQGTVGYTAYAGDLKHIAFFFCCFSFSCSKFQKCCVKKYVLKNIENFVSKKFVLKNLTFHVKSI